MTPDAARPLPAEPGGTVYRRRRDVVRRRRPNPLAALARLLAGPLLVLALPAAAGAWLLTSPRFAVAEIEVGGTARVAAGWASERLAPLAGHNLFALRLAEVEARLAGHPWVAGVEIHKRPPRRLEVEVRERQPRALVARGESLWFADGGGALLAPLAPGGDPEGLPVFRDDRSGGGTAPAPALAAALAVAAEIERTAPEWARGLAEIRLLGEGDFEIATAALPFGLRVRAGEVGSRAPHLARLLPELRRRYGELEAVDLRFSRRIVLTPLDGGGTGGEEARGAATEPS